jgi:DNA adenine methylase
MGSKQNLIPFIFDKLDKLKYETVLDAFAGSGCVAYEFKRRNKTVTTNDFLHCSYVISKAVIENDRARIDDETFSRLMRLREDAPYFVRKTYSDLFFTYEECYFLDSLWANIGEIQNEYQKHLAIAAACRACQKKRPRGIFTFTGRKSWDKRLDLRMSIEEQFANAVRLFNDAVFDNKKANEAHWSDTMDFKDNDFDLVYLDPPYWSPFSDNDYVRRYHFIEGYSRYWENLTVDMGTKARKFRSYESVFSKRELATKALVKLFHRYSGSIIAVSYSSNGYPTKEELLSMLQKVKRHVEIYEADYQYSFANQGNKKGNARNRVKEYLFIGV